MSLISTFAGASVLEKYNSDTVINAYSQSLRLKVASGGTLYCKENSKEKRVEFKSCQSFSALKEKGCFGDSTYDMGVESLYSQVCVEIKTIGKAASSKVNYFDLESSEWWKTIPAEVIPMSGGIYNDESWEIAKIERDELVVGKTLGDLHLSNLTKDAGVLNTIISKSTEECGQINDTLMISVTLLADFDQDGIAELLLKGYRVDSSDSCFLGSGNSLGSGFSVLVKKVSPEEVPVLLPYPLKEK